MILGSKSIFTHMINKDYRDESYINDLVDRYKATNDEALRIQLLKDFDPYFRKYGSLLCTKTSVDFSNKDTIKFLRMFMSPEERLTDNSIYKACRRVIPFLRGLFRDCTPQDVYDDMVCSFLEQLNRYKPMIANHKHDKPRISFTHFIQVNVRYNMVRLVVKRSKDALFCSMNLEYRDTLSPIVASDAWVNWNCIDLQWVNGATASDVFLELEYIDRYLLYLKYEYEDKKPLSDYDLAKITGLDRMYIRRKMLKIRDRLKELVDIN